MAPALAYLIPELFVLMSKRLTCQETYTIPERMAAKM